MPETEGNERVGPTLKKGKGDFFVKNKWLLIGSLAAIAALVFFFVNRSNKAAASGTNTATSTPSTGIDPATLASLLAANQSASMGVPGPAGPVGPAGPAGPTGKTGKTGARGPAGKTVTVRGKPHRSPKPRHSPPIGQTIIVRPGDTLASIARQYDHTTANLLALNQHTIGAGGMVYPGMRIRL